VEVPSIFFGVDEVGVGCLAGPVVAGAVVWQNSYAWNIVGLNDSKKLTLKQREKVFQQCKELNIVFATGSADVNEIEKLNIYHATRLAMKRAIDLVIPRRPTIPSIGLIDGKGYIEGLEIEQKWIVKGDEKEPAIMMASIVAKVLRDRYIKSLVDQFPEYEVYGWRTNIGYGTKKHLEAIKKYGLTPFHRKTFQPIKQWLEEGIINAAN